MTLLGIEKSGKKKRHRYECDACKCQFLSYRSRFTKQFCSRKCFADDWSTRNLVTLVCEVCQKEFRKQKCHSLRRVCSIKCRTKILPQTSIDVNTWANVSCNVCGKNIHKRKKDVGVRSYCSKECHASGSAIYHQTHTVKSHNAKGFRRGFYQRFNGEHVKYDSSWELHRMKELDYVEKHVNFWKRCDFSIPWIDKITDQQGKKRYYNPDFMIVYDDGSVVIEEIKGKLDETAVAKIAAGKEFCKSKNWQFRIISSAKKLTKGAAIKVQKYRNDFGVFTRPKMEYIWMSVALILSERSTCLRRKVGAVFTDHQMSTAVCLGYNGDETGGKNQCDSLEPGQCGCIHAETGALTKNNVDLSNGICFVTLAPCLMCSRILINRGIKKVIFHDHYRSTAGINLLRERGVEVIHYATIADSTERSIPDIHMSVENNKVLSAECLNCNCAEEAGEAWAQK